MVGSFLSSEAAQGRWMVAEYQPSALFSLKISSATSSVGRTLVVPTPYAIKMALVDAGFRAGLAEAGCAELLRSLVDVDIRVAPPEAAIVTHTVVKVRQEPKKRNPSEPYISAIAYREVVSYSGVWLWAFDLAGSGAALGEHIPRLAPYVSYIGKRGSFVQFRGISRRAELGPAFTLALRPGSGWVLPALGHVVPLDDFGPEASLEVLSTFSTRRAELDRHRVFLDTHIPLTIAGTGPGFTEYRATSRGVGG